MSKDGKKVTAGLTRRQALTGAAATLGVGLAAGGSASARAGEPIAATLPGAKMCILTPEAVEGPFYFDPKLVRADITEGREGAPLALALQVVSATDCAAIKGVRVDLWHADGLGMYSGYRGQGDDGVSTRGQTFLRGTQFTDADGQARFATIYPGWYPGRTPHIHFKVLLDAKSLVTGQLYFPDDLSTRIYAGNLALSRAQDEARHARQHRGLHLPGPRRCRYAGEHQGGGRRLSGLADHRRCRKAATSVRKAP